MSKDPWRYRCVECGSTQVITNSTYRRGDNPIRGGKPAESRYTCDECGAKRNQRKDMKTGGLVA